MTKQAASAGKPAGAPARLRGALRRAVATLPHRVPRLLLLAHFSLVSGSVVLIAKSVLFFIAPSWFLLANIVFAAGAIATKLFVLVRWRAARNLPEEERSRSARRLYARTGAAIVALAIVYIAACLPSVFGERLSGTHDLWAGVTIAAIAFTELALCLVGLITGRNDADPVASSIRRLNLCAALVLIVLAQSALLSAITPESQSLNGFTGMGFGALVLALGLGPLHRHSEALRAAPQNSPA